MQELSNFIDLLENSPNKRFYRLGMSDTTKTIINYLIEKVANIDDADERLAYFLTPYEYRDVIISAGEYAIKDVDLNILKSQTQLVTKAGADVYFENVDRYVGFNFFTSSYFENGAATFYFTKDVKQLLVYLKSQNRLDQFRKMFEVDDRWKL